MSKSTLNWVEDELFRICGLSDVDAAKFLISIAKEAKSKERCFKNIMKTETLEVDEKFTDELWNRGEKQLKSNAYQKDIKLAIWNSPSRNDLPRGERNTQAIGLFVYLFETRWT